VIIGGGDVGGVAAARYWRRRFSRLRIPEQFASQFQNQRNNFVTSRRYPMMQGCEPWDYLPVLYKDARAGDVDRPLQVLGDSNKFSVELFDLPPYFIV